MADSNTILNLSASNEFFRRLAQSSIERNQVPILDQGVFTGEFRDMRTPTEGQPQPLRLQEHLAQLRQQGVQIREGEPIPGFQVADPFESRGLGESITNTLKLAFNRSLTGTALEAFTGEKPIALEGFQPNKFEDYAAEILSFFQPLDLATLLAGGGIGGAIVKKVVTKSIAKKIAKGITKEAAEKATVAEFRQIGRRIVSSALPTGTAIGTFEGLRGFFDTKVRTGEFDVGDALKDALQGMALGLAVGATGGAIPPSVGKSLLPKLGTELGRFGAEVGVFGGLAPVIEEGRAPTIDDFQNAAAFLVGIKATQGILRKGFNRFRETVKESNDLQKAIDKGKDFNTEVQERLTSFLDPEIKALDREFKEVTTPKPIEIKKEPKIIKPIKKPPTPEAEKKLKGAVVKKGLNKEIFGKFNKDVEVTSVQVTSKGKKKIVFNINKAKTFDDVVAVVNKAREKGVNIFATKEFENTKLFKTMDARGQISKERSKGLKRIIIEPQIGLPFEAVGGRAARESQEAKFRAKQAAADVVSPETVAKITGIFTWIPDVVKQARNRVKTEIGKNVIGEIESVGVAAAGIEAKHLKLLDDAGINQKQLAKNIEKAKDIGVALADPNRQAEVSTARLVLDNLVDLYNDIVPTKDKIIKRKNYFPNQFTVEIRQKLNDQYSALQKSIDREGSLSVDNKVTESIISEHLTKLPEGAELRQLVDRIIKIKKTTKIKAVNLVGEMVLAESFTGRDLVDILGGEPFFFKKRAGIIPEEWVERNAAVVLSNYVARMSKKIAETKKWGVGYKKLQKDLIDLKFQDPKEHGFVTDMVKKQTGQFETEFGLKPGLREAVDIFTSVEGLLKISTGFAALLNVTQTFISTLLEAGVFDTIRGSMDLFNAKKVKFLKKTGIFDFFDERAYQAVAGHIPGGIWGKIALKASTLSGFTGINKFNILLSAATGHRYINRLIGQSKGTGRTAELAKARLADLKIDADKPITEKNLLEGIFRFANDSQLQRNITRDQAFLTDPRTRPFFLFKRFGLRQASYLKDILFKEAKRGNIMPFIRLGIGGVIGGEGMVWAMNTIKEILSGQPQYRTDEDQLLQRFINDIASIGAFGVVSDMMRIEKASEIGGALKFAITPVIISDLEQAYEGHTRFMKDWENYGDVFLATRRSLHTLTGFLGSYPRYFGERLKTPAQVSNKERFLKGQTKKEVFDLMLSNNGEAAGRRVETWNKNRPNNPITINDVSIKAMLKHFENKITRATENRFVKGTPEFKKALAERRREFRIEFSKKPLRKIQQEVRGSQ